MVEAKQVWRGINGRSKTWLGERSMVEAKQCLVSDQWEKQNRDEEDSGWSLAGDEEMTETKPMNR